MDSKMILIAMDSMKGSLSSGEANEVVRQTVTACWPDACVVTIPVSDGGEGFLDAVAAVGTWQRVTVDVLDPLMRPIRAQFLIRGRTAVVEMAQASGLGLLKVDERNPLNTTTYGTGQLIAEAVRRGAEEIVVGLGGSATSDCGRGALLALNDELGEMPSVGITLATDVESPLLGPSGAARVFAPQKGATAEMVEELERCAEEFACESAIRLGHDCRWQPGSGAAGGLGYGLMQYLGARRISGVDFILDHALCPEDWERLSLIITGEGKADRQTLMGKVPMGILRRARPRGIPVMLVAGQVADCEALLQAGFAQVRAITPPEMQLRQALQPDVARHNLRSAMSSMLGLL